MREEIASADNRDDMEQAELPASLASLPAGSVRMLQPGPMGLSELLAQVMSHNGIACRSEQRSCMGAFNLFFGGTNRCNHAAGQESHCQLCHTVGLSCVSALPLSAVLSADSPCLSCVSALPLPAFLCAVGLRGVGAAGDGRDRPAHWRG